MAARGTAEARGFDRVCALIVLEGDPPLLLTHMPVRAIPEGMVNVHGYIHQNPSPRPRQINVCVEQLGYRPAALPRVRALARELLAGRTPPGRTAERLAAVGG